MYLHNLWVTSLETLTNDMNFPQSGFLVSLITKSPEAGDPQRQGAILQNNNTIKILSRFAIIPPAIIGMEGGGVGQDS